MTISTAPCDLREIVSRRSRNAFHPSSRRGTIGADYQDVAIDQPFVELGKAMRANLDLDDAVDAEDRHGQIAQVRAASGTRQRHALGREATILQKLDNRAFGTIALVARCSAATHDAIRCCCCCPRASIRQANTSAARGAAFDAAGIRMAVAHRLVGLVRGAGLAYVHFVVSIALVGCGRLVGGRKSNPMRRWRVKPAAVLQTRPK